MIANAIDELKSQFRADLDSLMSTDEICRRYFSSNQIWIASRQRSRGLDCTSDDMIAFLSKCFDVPPADVTIIGSAKFGFSLNPTRCFGDFDDEKSDIDIAISNRRLFREFWDDFLNYDYSSANGVPKEYRKNVFRRFVFSKDAQNLNTPLAKNWAMKIDRMKRDFYIFFNISNTISFRVYMDSESAYQYNLKTLNVLRGRS